MKWHIIGWFETYGQHRVPSAIAGHLNDVLRQMLLLHCHSPVQTARTGIVQESGRQMGENASVGPVNRWAHAQIMPGVPETSLNLPDLTISIDHFMETNVLAVGGNAARTVSALGLALFSSTANRGSPTSRS